jgi:hypothetical protein
MVESDGSFVPHEESLEILSICSLANHWYQMRVPEATMFIGFSGRGYFPDLI